MRVFRVHSPGLPGSVQEVCRYLNGYRCFSRIRVLQALQAHGLDVKIKIAGKKYRRQFFMVASLFFSQYFSVRNMYMRIVVEMA
jgi:hypothetical protein